MRTDERNTRHSLTGAILNEGLRVVVLHPDDSDGATLIAHLKRMGCHVQAFWPSPVALPEQVDLVFRVLLPSEREPTNVECGPNGPPLICIIAHENPTFIDQSWKMGASAIITSPIRTSGLLSTIIFALQHARLSKRQAARISTLEEKLQGMRCLVEAKAILMQMHTISEEAAYDILRSQAMAKRSTVEAICHSIIEANEVFMRIPNKTPVRGPE